MDLHKKLHLKKDQPLWLINAPADCKELFNDLELHIKLGKEKPAGQLILFAADSKELNHYLAKLTPYIGHSTLFWVCYPKKSGAIASDLALMDAWNIVFSLGYRSQTSVSVNDNWTGMRFTNAPAKKPSTYDLPPELRNIEGIDHVKRTVLLPADAEAMINKHTGMKTYFYSQSFTCQKEYAVAILDAKKPETRQRRIEKMIEMLQQKMMVKSAKKG